MSQILQEAAQIKALAEAEGEKVRLVGVGEAARVRSLAEAEAEKAARVGIGQALAIEEQVRAYGGPQLQLRTESMRPRDAALAATRDRIRSELFAKLKTPGNGAGATASVVVPPSK